MLTVEKELFIRNYYLTMSNKELAELTGLTTGEIIRFLSKNNLNRLKPFVLQEGEELRDIKDFPNYQISNFGRLKNKSRGNEVIAIHYDENKYKNLACTCFVIRNKNGKKVSVLVSKLVMEAFNPLEKENYDKIFICHKDFDYRNNRLDNLFYLTKEEFYKRNIEEHRIGNYIYTDEQIKKVCEMLKEERTYEEIKKEVPLSYSHRCHLKNKRRRRDITKNYKF